VLTRSDAPAVETDTSLEHDLPFWVALHRVHRLGAVRFATLEHGFPTMEAAWCASAAELRAAGLDRASIAAIEDERERTDPSTEMERLAAQGVTALAIRQPAYPARLREIPDAPPVIYVKGSLTSDDEWAVAVVGTRRATAYGRQATAELVRGLAANGVTVVSGLARGVDTIAHRTALDAGGRTVAVLANGLDTVYPPENRGWRRRSRSAGRLSRTTRSARSLARVLPPAEPHPLGTRARHADRRGRLSVRRDDHGALRGRAEPRRLRRTRLDLLATVARSAADPRRRDPGPRRRDILEALNLTMLGSAARLRSGRAASESEDERCADVRADARAADTSTSMSRRGLAAATVSGTLALLEFKGLVRDVGGCSSCDVREDTLPI
jgi:DNA processing protein